LGYTTWSYPIYCPSAFNYAGVLNIPAVLTAINYTATYNIHGTVRGYYYNTLGGANINVTYPNSTVYYNIYTAGDGTYSFNVLGTDPTGDYNVNYSCSGYQTSYEGFKFPDFFISHGNSVQNDVALVPYTGTTSIVNVQVYNKATGYTIDGALTQLVYSNGSLFQSATTANNNNNDGTAIFNGVPQGSYTITASISGYYSTSYSLTITSDNLQSVNIGLSPVSGTATPIVSVTPSYTPSITPTPTAGNQSVGQLVQVGLFPALLGLFTSVFGVDNDTAGFMLGCTVLLLFTILFGYIGRKVLGGGTSTLILAGVGFALGYVAGLIIKNPLDTTQTLIPSWTLFVILVLVCAFYILWGYLKSRSGGSGKGGED
jgi:hypothetical protein